MDWTVQIKERNFLSPPQQPLSISQPPPPSLSSSQSSDFSLYNRVNPTILIIIIILSVIFFISGLLHLLLRFLLRPSNRNPDEIDNLTALQGQLQQLFHLHDSGVDQSFIDTLPVFNYKAIIGVKDPFDCAVCLCEFEFEDRLRLLPKCSHAFHMDCIDTWLLSHSTCPLCRASLAQDFPQNSSFSPVVMILESGGESSRERVVPEREAGSGNVNSVERVNSHLSAHHGDGDCGLNHADAVQKSDEIQEREDGISGERVVSVKLGKFRSVGGGDEGSSEINAEARRCFSMGSFAYIMDENSSLKVAITTPMKKQRSKKPSLPLKPGHRLAMSECGRDSRGEFNGFDAFKILEIQSGGNDNKSIVRNKRDSFSVSKIWLRGRKDETNSATMESSRRAFSFRFPTHRHPVAAGESDIKNGDGGGGGGGGDGGGLSEIETSRRENGDRELDVDEEMQKCNSLECEGDHPSFGRRTVLWLMGRQNKVVRSSFSSNIV